MRHGSVDRGDDHMSSFTPAEIEYLRSQRLGRLATVNAAGEPHVVPVGFRYNAELDTIDIGGHGVGKSKKYRDANGRPVAFVVDDVLPPWQVRGIEVRGRAEALAQGGKEIRPQFDDELIRIKPARIISWGIESDAHRPNSRNVG
jgi:pyridoxamine 5'-phosphate oxidase family protein